MQNILEQWSPEYISVGFIAKHCGVSNTTVWRWITNGQLPAFRLPGGHYRVERNDFSKFLEKHSMPVKHISQTGNEEKHSYMPRGNNRNRQIKDSFD